jgi:hypothetical protein
MPAILTGPGITFGDNTTLSGKYDIIAQLSVMVFFQAAAPTGWTKSTAHNDAALRVVSGTGGVAAGTINFTVAFPNSLKTVSGSASITATSPNGNNTTSSTTLTAAQIPRHAHPASTGPAGAHVHSYQRTNVTPNLNRFQGVENRPSGGNDIVSTSPENPHGHGVTISPQGGGGAHFHGWSFQSAPISTTIDLRVQYCNTIICSLN